MKELKHLMYFERLLDDAHNELVRQAEAEGDLAIGYTCFHAPEVLLNLGSCFSVRLRAPHTTSMELATYYMANNSCEFSRDDRDEQGCEKQPVFPAAAAAVARNKFREHLHCPLPAAP